MHHIRPATAADLPAVAELAEHIWRTYYPSMISVALIDYMLAQRYNPQALAALLSIPGHRLDLLEADGALAGFAHHIEHAAHETKLDKLYLSPTLHGQGLGMRLMQHVQALAEAKGHHTLLLYVAKTNRKAIDFYQRAGFALREAVCIDIGNGFVMDDYLMAKPLS